MKGPFIFASFFFFIISRSIIVILHELGHAIPALLFTKQKVTVYIGSYGDPKKSIHFKIGLLEFWCSYKIFSWESGLCRLSSNAPSLNKQIIYVLLGPLFPLFFASIYLYFSIINEFDDYYVYFGLIFFVLSLLDLKNLIPDKKPIELYDGNLTYNDGYTLSRLFRHKKNLKQYTEAVDLYNDKEYKKAIPFFDLILKRKVRNEDVYRLNIFANIQIRDFERAKILFDEYKKDFTLASDDYSNGGLIYSELNLHEKALELYDKSLSINGNNVYSLNNKGYTLNLLDRYSEAIPYFDKAIESNELFAYAYNNRGLSKFKTGNVSEGLKDIDKSIEIDKDNSYSYRNLGIYHFDIGEIEKARELFLKSKELDRNTHMIDELILSTEN
jgi:tetratricopeptide (TPR) repeat protein